MRAGFGFSGSMDHPPPFIGIIDEKDSTIEASLIKRVSRMANSRGRWFGL